MGFVLCHRSARIRQSDVHGNAEPPTGVYRSWKTTARHGRIASILAGSRRGATGNRQVMKEQDKPKTTPARNLLGEPLQLCGEDPMTGFYRDGCCNTGPEDRGSHTVCVEVSEEFLVFTASRGNDLATPRPEFGFPGLKPGDRWCLCAARWLEAHEAGKAPRVHVVSTHEAALQVVPRSLLMSSAVDLN